MRQAPPGRSPGPPALPSPAPAPGAGICDPVTGLCDWRAFHQTLREAALLATQTGEPLSLLMIDLSEAAAAASPRGRRAADELLRAAAQRLRALTAERARIARYNGARFVVILPRTDLAAAEAQARRFGSAFADDDLLARLARQERPTTPAIGAVQFRDDESLGLCLQRVADAVARYPASASMDGRVPTVADP